MTSFQVIFVCINKSARNFIMATLEPENPKRLGPKGSKQRMKMEKIILQTYFRVEKYLMQLGKRERKGNFM